MTAPDSTRVVRLAAEEPEIDEPLGDDAGGSGVHVEPLASRSALLDRRIARGRDERVQGLLLRCERAGGGIRAGDVTRVAADFGAGVDEDELAVCEDARRRREVEHGRVRSACDDRLVGARIPAVAEEGGLDLDLQLPLASTGGDQLRRDREPSLGRTLRLSHPLELDLVLDSADPVQLHSAGRLRDRRRTRRLARPHRGSRSARPCGTRASAAAPRSRLPARPPRRLTRAAPGLSGEGRSRPSRRLGRRREPTPDARGRSGRGTRNARRTGRCDRRGPAPGAAFRLR